MVFNLSEREFQFLRVFFEMPQLMGFEALPDPGRLGELTDPLDSLEQKKYLHKDEEGKYYLEDKLNFLFSVIKGADAAYTIEGRGKRFAAYFKEDAIVLLTIDHSHQMMWLPFLPFLIGAAADFLNPFLNTATDDLGTCTLDELPDLREKWTNSGYKKEWAFSFFEDRTESLEQVFETYSDGSRQILLRQDGDKIFLSAPGKADFVNALTRIAARLHTNAIQKGGSYERN